MQTGEMVDEPSLIAKQDDDLVVRTSERPPETEPTCPRTGPPNSWFEKYGLYTPNCGACKNLELGLPRSGKSHSAGCCRAYVEWLKEERTKLSAVLRVKPRLMFVRQILSLVVRHRLVLYSW